MTRCFEVTTKRMILTSVNSLSVYNKENDILLTCSDHDLFRTILIGDYVGVDNNGNITKRVSKESYLLTNLIEKSNPVTLYK